MNDVQKRGLARLMLRWPQRRMELRQKCSSGAGLLDLCEVYQVTCEAASYWEKITSPAGEARAEEYRALALEIEREVNEALASV
ncbi:hypothetical protein AB4Z40_35180 [Bosea sp. 2YAB26]|uniref:hypothetical protein n=1 Tax=Bosea sp. 2YAB26 TaxID=3237478 RepID=UPI002B5B5763|nr:hypothetical protein [Mycoplana sp.]